MISLHLFLGVGMVVSGFTLIRSGLRSRNMALWILQLIAGIALLIFGGYTIYSSIV